MSNNTLTKTEEQIKAEIAELVKENITKFNDENPRLCKKNKKIYEKLKTISPDEIVLFHFPSVLRVKDLEFELLRSYNYVDREGCITSSEYTNKPMTLTTSMLGITKPIYIVKVPDKHYKRIEIFYNKLLDGCDGYDGYRIYNDFTEDGLYRDIREAFEDAYRYHRQAQLAIDPEKTNRVICSKWKILDAEPVTDCPRALIVWKVDLDKNRTNYAVIFGEYDSSKDKIELIDTKRMLIGAAYSDSYSSSWLSPEGYGKELLFKCLGK